MNETCQRLIAVLLVVFAVACGSPPAASEPGSLQNRAVDTPEPAAPPEPVVPEGRRSDEETLSLALRAVDEMARSAANAVGHCPMAASAIESLVLANADVFAELDAIAADAERSVVLDAGADRISASASRLADGLGGCITDRGVRHSLEGMAFTRAP